MSLNKVMLVGNLGADPEMKTLPSGQSVAKFSIATTDVWKDKNGERQERTEWHRVSAWGKQGEYCASMLTKGQKVHIEGRLQTRSWEDKETAQKRYSTEIVADRVIFLDRKPGGREASSAQGEEHDAVA